MTTADPSQWGATAVITHRVQEGQKPGYEKWLEEIGPLCKSYPGNLDLQIIRPIEGVTGTYTVVIRFDSHEHLLGWMNSQDRARLIRQVRPLLAKDDEFFVRTGLDFWFAPQGAKALVPVRWKQFLITWSAIFPLGFLVSFLMLPLLDRMGIRGHAFRSLILSGIVVALMVYVVMPHYTRLVRRWLFR